MNQIIGIRELIGIHKYICICRHWVAIGIRELGIHELGIQLYRHSVT